MISIPEQVKLVWDHRPQRSPTGFRCEKCETACPCPVARLLNEAQEHSLTV